VSLYPRLLARILPCVLGLAFAGLAAADDAFEVQVIESSGRTVTAELGDFDGDGRQDLLGISYGRQWNRQWRNLGKGKFEEIGIETGFAGDGITHGRYPERVRAKGRKDEDPFRSNGNTFDCAVADFDNDGDLDLYSGNGFITGPQEEDL